MSEHPANETASLAGETELAAIDQAAAEMDADYQAAQQKAEEAGLSPTSWLPNWYLKTVCQLKSARNLIKDQAKVLLAQVDARERALQWHRGLDMKAQVDADLSAQPGKKKSVDYFGGRAGYRKKPERVEVTVTDEAVAIQQLEPLCPEAVRKSIHLPTLKAYIQQTGDVPEGVNAEIIEAHDEFYPSIELPKLEAKTGDDE